MAFWGVEVKPGKPFNHEHDDSNGRLHISMATLGFGTAKEKSILQCNVGDKSPVYLCSLYPGSCESCQLNLEYEESDEVIFSVIGPRSIHLCGYYLRSGRNANIKEDSESFGEDIKDTETERSGSSDDDEYEDSFIDDDADPEVFPPSSVSIEEKASLDKRPKVRKGRLQRLRRKYQSIESDDDGCLEEKEIVNDSMDDLSEEINKEDSLPISFLLKNKASRRVLDKDNEQDVPKKDKMDRNLLTGNKQNVEHTNDKDTETMDNIPSSEVGQGESPMEEMNRINLVANGADHCNLDKLPQRNEPGQHLINNEAEKADKKPSFDIGSGESTMEGINLVSNGVDHCNLDNLPQRNEPNGQNLFHQETETRVNIASTETGHGESTMEGINLAANGADHCNLDNLPQRNETNEVHLIHEDAEIADKIPSFDIGHGESTMEEINLVSNGVDHCNLDNLPLRNEPDDKHLIHEEAEAAEKLPSFDIGHGESTMEEMNLVSNGVGHCNLDNPPQRNEPHEQHLIHPETETDKIPSAEIGHGECTIDGINLAANGADHCNLDNQPLRNEPSQQHLIHEETEKEDKIPSFDIGAGESTLEGINLVSNGVDHCNLDNLPQRNESNEQNLIHAETETRIKIPSTEIAHGESTMEGINLAANGADHCNLVNQPLRNEPSERHLTHENGEFSDAVTLTLTNEGPEKRTRKRKKKGQVNSSSHFKGDNAYHNDVIKEYEACKDKVETDNGIHKLDDEEDENKKLKNKMRVDNVAYGFPDGSQSEDRKVEKRKKRRKRQMNVEVINCEMPPLSVKQSGETVKVVDRNKADAKPSHVRTLADGLVIEEFEMGTKNGKIARSGRKISVYYTGWLKENGIVYESNFGQAPFKFHLGEGKVIKGWDVGIEGMRVGEMRRLTIPPSMAFESEGHGSIIPPNSWVVYNLELVKVCR